MVSEARHGRELTVQLCGVGRTEKIEAKTQHTAMQLDQGETWGTDALLL